MAQHDSWSDSAMDIDRDESPDTIQGDSPPPPHTTDDDDAAPNVIDLDRVEDLLDLEAGDFMTDEDFDRMFPGIAQNVQNGSTRSWRDDQTAATHHRLIESFSTNGSTYRKDKTVELRDGDFLRIVDILEDKRNQAIFLRGPRFRRVSRFRGIFDLHLNEVVLLVEHTERTPLEATPHTAESCTIPLSDVIKIRELVLTNEAYPLYSYKEDRQNRRLSRAAAREQCRLVCRWKVLTIHQVKGPRKVCVEMAITRLRTEASDHNYQAGEAHLREEWRGATVPGGRCLSWLPGERDFDVAEQRHNRGVDILGFHRQSVTHPGTIDLTTNALRPVKAQRYTFGDAFCGAGGASRGAKGAGLRVDWGFDFDPAAIESYGKNFFATRCEVTPADVFISSTDGNYGVEILHISPPCQPFSPIHVHTGKDDEMNSSSLFAVGELLKKTRPRIVTLENTFGLAQAKWKDWLNTMVQVFTALGWSVRWRVLNLAEYGLPQARRRLILIASCPGETLPCFPAPTHGPGRQRYSTIHDAIGRIPNGFSQHDISGSVKRNAPPYDPNLPLRNCVTTAGSMDVHPNGKRGFTVRELLCLQSFPLEHEFGQTKVKRQAGNAVPPLFALALFQHIRRWLEEADS
ncbi:MAG: hypothetical protein Q9208_003668 [Pyrenodesmia sp. 3 TL-2023]